jgi:hypothetical protein
MTLTDYSALAQIVLTIITLIGILTSMYLSVRAIREVQLDRKIRQRPCLAFEPGGFILPVKFESVQHHVPGIDPEFAKKAFPNLPKGAESVRLWEEDESGKHKPLFFGRLTNYGLGPAISANVTWIPKEITIGSEPFSVDGRKLEEPCYRAELNTMPTAPSHILPGRDAKLSRLPTFIDKDFEKKITKVKGVLEITCEDVFGGKVQNFQEFYIHTSYFDARPSLIVTFGDPIGTADGDAI